MRTPHRGSDLVFLFERSLCARPQAGHFVTLTTILQAGILIPPLHVKKQLFREDR